jgi:NAD(P)-dependent dehydrogenase (short-subunit alcohol dehydrogenase family)
VNPYSRPAGSDIKDEAFDKDHGSNVMHANLLARWRSAEAELGKGRWCQFSIGGHSAVTVIGARHLERRDFALLLAGLAGECGEGVRVNCVAPGLVLKTISPARSGRSENSKRAPGTRSAHRASRRNRRAVLSGLRRSIQDGQTIWSLARDDSRDVMSLPPWRGGSTAHEMSGRGGVTVLHSSVPS